MDSAIWLLLWFVALVLFVGLCTGTSFFAYL
jgi:hypothetical protein